MKRASMYHPSVPSCRISTLVMVDFAAGMVLHKSSLNDPFSLVPVKSNLTGSVKWSKYILIWVVSSDFTSSLKIPVWYFKHNSKAEIEEISSHIDGFIFVLYIFIHDVISHFKNIYHMDCSIHHSRRLPHYHPGSRWSTVLNQYFIHCYQGKLRDISNQNIFDTSIYNMYVLYTCTTRVWIIIR